MAFERSTQNQRTDKKEKSAIDSQKLKEVQPNTQIQRYCTTFNFAPTHQSPPTTPNSKYWQLTHIAANS